MGRFATKNNGTFNKKFEDFCKHGGLRFEGLEFENGEDMKLNQVLYHNNAPVMRKMGRGDSAFWCSSKGYHLLEWDLTKPLYRQPNSTTDPLFVKPSTFSVTVHRDTITLEVRFGNKVKKIKNPETDNTKKKKKKKKKKERPPISQDKKIKNTETYYNRMIKAAMERSWDSLQAFCNGKQWLGGDVFLGEDGLVKGYFEPEDERTYQAMLVAAILETSGFAPHNQTLYLKHTLLQKREIGDTRCACVSAEGNRSMTRLEILPQCPANRRFTASAVVQYEGNAARHLREPDGVPYNWTFSKNDKKKRNTRGSPTTTTRRRESRLTIGCGASFSGPSGTQRFLHRRAFPLTSKAAFTMKECPSQRLGEGLVRWSDTYHWRFQRPGGVPSSKNAGIGGGKEDADAMKRLRDHAEKARELVERSLTTATSVPCTTYDDTEEAVVERWSQTKREAVRNIQSERLVRVSERFRECHMYLGPAVELSAASLTLTQDKDDKNEQADYPTLFMGPSTYGAGEDGTYLGGGRPHDYQHPSMEMEATEPLFMDIVYHGSEKKTGQREK